MKKSKTALIKEHLVNKGSITSLEAFELYKATRLSAIIFNLKSYGWKFNIDYTNDYAIYYLVNKGFDSKKAFKSFYFVED